MKIKYTFVNGEETSVEVYDDFEDIILELNRNLYNNNQTETRRHISLSVFDEDKEVFTDIKAGFEEQLSDQVGKEILYKAISELNYDEKELLHNLYLSDCPLTQKEYARILQIREKSVQEKSRRIRKKLKRIIEEKS